MKMKVNKHIFGYIVFGIVMMMVFLYLRFPGAAVRDYIVSIASEKTPEGLLSIGTVKPGFPPGLDMEKIDYGVKRNPDATIHIDHLTARFGLLDMFKGDTTLLLKGLIYGGRLSGHIDFADFMTLSRPVNFEFKLNNLKLDKCAYLQETLNRQIKGTLEGNFIYHHSYERKGDRNGTGEFVISNGSYPLKENLLGFKNIDFSKLDGRVTMKGNVLKIDRLKINGANFDCALQGDVVLDKNIESSVITINGYIEIAGMGGKRMKVAIGGILSNPTVRLM